MVEKLRHKLVLRKKLGQWGIGRLELSLKLQPLNHKNISFDSKDKMEKICILQ